MVSAPVKIGRCHQDVVVGTEDVDNCTDGTSLSHRQAGLQ